MVIERLLLDALTLFPSVTFTPKEYRPAAVGMPVISPVVELSERPGGSDPYVVFHVYGAIPAEVPKRGEIAIVVKFPV